MAEKLQQASSLMEALGLGEEPLGMHYTDQEPEQGFAPKPMELPTVEQEAAQQVDWPPLWKNFSCVIGHIWLARKKGRPAYFDRQRFGCLGGAFFLGFNKPQLETIVHYVSTGIPGVVEGERYLDSPELTRRFYQELDPEPAPARFCVFKPLSSFAPGEQPQLVMCFDRPEVISGLHQLAVFVTGDFEAVKTPFGSGCSDLVTWPLKYQRQGRLKAVVGGWDPSCRKFLKTDELSFAMPWALWKLMQERWPQSFLTTGSWQVVRKKIARSRRAWGEA